MNGSAVVFGSRGLLGSAVAAAFEEAGVHVVRATRSASAEGWIGTDTPDWTSPLRRGSINSAVWAQGENAQGSVLDDGPDQLRDLLEANVLYIVDTLRALLDHGALTNPARLVIISSVWQTVARPDKLAYVTSKSALGGLVASLAADLGQHGISVNAVLPGVVDSPMARTFLSPQSLLKVVSETPTAALISAEDVARACSWLASPASAGVNGQSLVVDGGWSAVRHV